MADLGSSVWFLAVLGGTTLLGLAFAYAVAQFTNRDRRLDPVREEATRRNYAAEEREEELAEATAVRPVAPPVTEEVRRRSNAA